MSFDRDAVQHPRKRVPLSEVRLNERLTELIPPDIPLTPSQYAFQTLQWCDASVLRPCVEMDPTPTVCPSSVDQLAALFKAIQANPFDTARLQEAGCRLRHLASHPAPAATAMFGEGKNAGVFRGLFSDPMAATLFPPDRPPAFVIKTQHDPHNLRETIETYNESIVGLHCTNPLRALIPNFVYVYGAYLCAPPTVDPATHVITLCPSLLPVGQTGTLHLMIETIPDALPLRVWVATASLADVDGVFRQVILALAIAQQTCGFSHNDLHTDNILIRDLGTPTALSYPLGGGRSMTITTRYLAMIIDLGRASATLPVRLEDGTRDQRDTLLDRSFSLKKSGFKAGFIMTQIGCSLLRSNTIYDVCRVFGASLYYLLKANRIDDAVAVATQWLGPLCTPGMPLRAFLLSPLFAAWTDAYHIAPFTIDIDLADFIETVMGVPFGTRLPAPSTVICRAPEVPVGAATLGQKAWKAYEQLDLAFVKHVGRLVHQRDWKALHRLAPAIERAVSTWRHARNLIRQAMIADRAGYNVHLDVAPMLDYVSKTMDQLKEVLAQLGP